METEPQRASLAEIPLSGGRLTPGIMRVGNTVRRPSKGNAAFVHDLLVFLEDRGFPFAPRKTKAMSTADAPMAFVLRARE